MLWFYGSTSLQKGNAASPDYILCLLSIASIEEQQIVLDWYKHKGIELENPDNPAQLGDVLTYKFNVKKGRSLSAVPPNVDSSCRTYCMACKIPVGRNDLHRWCCHCSAEEGDLLCPLTGLCQVCISMNFWDLKTRYQRLCSAINDLAANVKITPRFLHMSLACQYDANVKMVDDVFNALVRPTTRSPPIR